MRPETLSLGTLTTSATSTVAKDVTNYRERSLQLTGTFGGGSVSVKASLDGGTTFSQVATASAAGFLTLPQTVLGVLRLDLTGGDGTTSIGCWFAGLNTRTE